MTTRCARPTLLALLGCLALLSGLLAPMTSYTLVKELVRDEGLQAIEVIHKQNIGQLHGLHHELRATLKQLRKGRSDHETAQQLASQLSAMNQVLEIVAATEQDHPQWASSWSHRHARLVLLTQETKTLLLTANGSRAGTLPLDKVEAKLQEMKEILDIW